MSLSDFTKYNQDEYAEKIRRIQRHVRRKNRRRKKVKEIVDAMIEGGKQYLGVPRYNWHPEDDNMTLDEFNLKYGNKDIAPFYCTNNTVIPNVQSLVCYGLTNLMMRHGGIELPFFQRQSQYEDLRYGMGGSDEWMCLYYNKLEIFDVNGKYPRGTLLLRNFDRMTQGHTAMLIESSEGSKKLEDCKVIHSAGDALCPREDDNKYKEPTSGTCPGVCIQKVGDQLKYFEKTYSEWDIGQKAPNVPYSFNYYQAVLFPEDYIINIDLTHARMIENQYIREQKRLGDDNKDGRRSPTISAAINMFLFGDNNQEKEDVPLKF